MRTSRSESLANLAANTLAQVPHLRGGARGPQFSRATLGEAIAYIRDHHITELVACEFSGAVLTARRQRYPGRVISCDVRKASHEHPHYQGDVRDIIDIQRWDAIFWVGPNCFQHLRRDQYLVEKIEDGRAYWAAAMVLWCICQPVGNMLVVEQPDTIANDFIRAENLPGVVLREYFTNWFGDKRRKFVRLVLRNASEPLVLHQPVPDDDVERRPGHLEYRDADERDRARSSWARLPRFAESVANLEPVRSGPPAPLAYVEQSRRLASCWPGPLPVGFDNPTGLPLSEDERHYQLVRGKGDPARSLKGKGAPPPSAPEARKAEPGNQVLKTDPVAIFVALMDRLTAQGTEPNRAQEARWREVESRYTPGQGPVLYFWRPTKAEAGERAVLSNYFEKSFVEPAMPGVTFEHVEKYLHYAKAILFKDEAAVAEIRLLTEPQACRNAGRAVLNFDDGRWAPCARQIAERAVYLKFHQNAELRCFLLNTDEAELVEASPYDRRWGIGFDESLAERTPRKRWGTNWLGHILMRVRARLRLNLPPTLPKAMSDAGEAWGVCSTLSTGIPAALQAEPLTAGAEPTLSCPSVVKASLPHGPSASPTVRLLQGLLGDRASIHECGGDGSCIPNSLQVSAELAGICPPLGGSSFRACVMTHARSMVKDDTLLAHEAGGEMLTTPMLIEASLLSWRPYPPGTERGRDDAVHDWLELMERDATWADCAFLVIAADWLQCDIVYYALRGDGELQDHGTISPRPGVPARARLEIATILDCHCLAVLPTAGAAGARPPEAPRLQLRAGDRVQVPECLVPTRSQLAEVLAESTSKAEERAVAVLSDEEEADVVAALAADQGAPTELERLAVADSLQTARREDEARQLQEAMRQSLEQGVDQVRAAPAKRVTFDVGGDDLVLEDQPLGADDPEEDSIEMEEPGPPAITVLPNDLSILHGGDLHSLEESEGSSTTTLVIPYAHVGGEPVVLVPSNEAALLALPTTPSVAVSQIVPTAEAAVSTVVGPDAPTVGFAGGRNADGQRLVMVATEATGPVARDPAGRRRLASAGALLIWCTTMALTATSWQTTLGRLAVASLGHFTAYDGTTSSLIRQDYETRQSAGFEAGRAGYHAPERAVPPGPVSVTPRQLIETTERGLLRLREALRARTGGTAAYFHEWAAPIGPLQLGDVEDGLLDRPMDISVEALGRRLYAPPLPVYELPWLPRMPDQVWEERAGCAAFQPAHALDLYSQTARDLLWEWFRAAKSDALCLEERGAACSRSDRPPAIAIGQDQMVPCARGYVWDCRQRPCRLLDNSAPISTDFNLGWLRAKLLDYPDQRLASNMLEGIRLEADVELTTVLNAQLVSMGPGYDSVQRTVRELRDLNFYDFFAAMPYAPIFVIGQGSRAKSPGSSKYRRTSDFGAPRRQTLDGSGRAVVPINDASKCYVIPEWIYNSPIVDIRRWGAAKYAHVPGAAQEGQGRPVGSPSTRHKFPKEHKPNLGEVMQTLAILLLAASLMGEPIFVWVEDAAYYFNQFGYAPEELWKSNLLVSARPGDLTEGGMPFQPGQVVFVSEKRLGFGSYASSNIAQRFSNALTGWTLEEFDRLEAEARRDNPNPSWEAWIQMRQGLEEQCRRDRPKQAGVAPPDCNQQRLAALTMYSDDPVAIVVGVERAVRLLEAWRLVTRTANVQMAGPEKRQLGGGVLWVGVGLLAAIGLVVVPKNKLLRANDALRRAVDGQITVDDFRRLLGLLEHLRFIARLQADVTNVLYAPYRRGGAAQEGPTTLLQPTLDMQGALQKWIDVILHCAGAVATAAFTLGVAARLDRATAIVAASSDAAGDGRGEPGMGGYLHGYFWRVALPPALYALLHITGWECLATCVTILVAARWAGSDATLAVQTDALLTPYAVAHQKSSSPDIQAILQRLLAQPSYHDDVAGRVVIRHLSGEGNVPSDLVSRGLWVELLQLAEVMHVKPIVVPLAPEEQDFITSVLTAVATRRNLPLDQALLQTCLRYAVPAAFETRPKRRLEGRHAKRSRDGQPPVQPELLGLGRAPACPSYDGSSVESECPVCLCRGSEEAPLLQLMCCDAEIHLACLQAHIGHVAYRDEGSDSEDVRPHRPRCPACNRDLKSTSPRRLLKGVASRARGGQGSATPATGAAPPAPQAGPPPPASPPGGGDRTDLNRGFAAVLAKAWNKLWHMLHGNTSWPSPLPPNPGVLELQRHKAEWHAVRIAIAIEREALLQLQTAAKGHASYAQWALILARHSYHARVRGWGRPIRGQRLLRDAGRTTPRGRSVRTVKTSELVTTVAAELTARGDTANADVLTAWCEAYLAGSKTHTETLTKLASVVDRGFLVRTVTRLALTPDPQAPSRPDARSVREEEAEVARLRRTRRDASRLSDKAYREHGRLCQMLEMQDALAKHAFDGWAAAASRLYHWGPPIVVVPWKPRPGRSLSPPPSPPTTCMQTSPTTCMQTCQHVSVSPVSSRHRVMPSSPPSLLPSFGAPLAERRDLNWGCAQALARHWNKLWHILHGNIARHELLILPVWVRALIVSPPRWLRALIATLREWGYAEAMARAWNALWHILHGNTTWPEQPRDSDSARHRRTLLHEWRAVHRHIDDEWCDLMVQSQRDLSKDYNQLAELMATRSILLHHLLQLEEAPQTCAAFRRSLVSVTDPTGDAAAMLRITARLASDRVKQHEEALYRKQDHYDMINDVYERLARKSRRGCLKARMLPRRARLSAPPPSPPLSPPALLERADLEQAYASALASGWNKLMHALHGNGVLVRANDGGSAPQELARVLAAGQPHIRTIQFMAGDQEPRDRINKSGRRGVAANGDHLIEETLKARDLLCLRLGRRTAMWGWLAYRHAESIQADTDVDITLALDESGTVLGAAAGVYHRRTHTYLTHVTAVRRDRASLGIGAHLRRAQLQRQLTLRDAPPRVVSLSSPEAQGDKGSAVSWQRHVLGKLGYQLTAGDVLPDADAHQAIMAIDTDLPYLRLSQVLHQEPVLPLLFEWPTPVPMALPATPPGSPPPVEPRPDQERACAHALAKAWKRLCRIARGNTSNAGTSGDHAGLQRVEDVEALRMELDRLRGERDRLIQRASELAVAYQSEIVESHRLRSLVQSLREEIRGLSPPSSPPSMEGASDAHLRAIGRWHNPDSVQQYVRVSVEPDPASEVAHQGCVARLWNRLWHMLHGNTARPQWPCEATSLEELADLRDQWAAFHNALVTEKAAFEARYASVYEEHNLNKELLESTCEVRAALTSAVARLWVSSVTQHRMDAVMPEWMSNYLMAPPGTPVPEPSVLRRRRAQADAANGLVLAAACATERMHDAYETTLGTKARLNDMLPIRGDYAMQISSAEAHLEAAEFWLESPPSFITLPSPSSAPTPAADPPTPPASPPTPAFMCRDFSPTVDPAKEAANDACLARHWNHLWHILHGNTHRPPYPMQTSTREERVSRRDQWAHLHGALLAEKAGLAAHYQRILTERYRNVKTLEAALEVEAVLIRNVESLLMHPPSRRPIAAAIPWWMRQRLRVPLPDVATAMRGAHTAANGIVLAASSAAERVVQARSDIESTEALLGQMNTLLRWYAYELEWARHIVWCASEELLEEPPSWAQPPPPFVPRWDLNRVSDDDVDDDSDGDSVPDQPSLPGSPPSPASMHRDLASPVDPAKEAAHSACLARLWNRAWKAMHGNIGFSAGRWRARPAPAASQFRPLWAAPPAPARPSAAARTDPAGRQPMPAGKPGGFQPLWVGERRAMGAKDPAPAPAPAQGAATPHAYVAPAYGNSQLRRDQLVHAHGLAQRLANDRTPGRIDAPFAQLEHMAQAVAEARADGINPRTASKDAFAMREFTAYAADAGFDPNLQTAWTRRFPERESLKLASFLIWRAVRAIPRSRKGIAKPMSVYQNYLALRRVFRSRDVELPPAGVVRETLRGLIRRFIRRYGLDALRAKRVEPVTPTIVAKMVALAERGDQAVCGIPWTLDNHTCFTVTGWSAVNLSIGSRLGESTELPGDVDENDCYNRESVSHSIGGRTLTDPSPAQLASMTEGDHSAMAPRGSKCDQYGTCHGTEPMILPFHDEPLNASKWLRDMELRTPCRGAARRTTPLFADEAGRPFKRDAFAKMIAAVLTAVLGATRASLYSPHSWRVWLASALRMAGASDARIQAMGRWLNPESIKTYARMSKQEYALWVDKLMHVRHIDTARTTSLPVMDLADAIALMEDSKFDQAAQPDLAPTALVGGWDGEPKHVAGPPPVAPGTRIEVYWTDHGEWFAGTYTSSKVEPADDGGRQRASRVVYDAAGAWAGCSKAQLTYYHCLDDELWRSA